ncbi:DNA/RNA non-specific endonuclease [Xanthocytophaga agilis]|uniref:Endonuclease n=1 Tax=Xanthocytophaga agilis TaxID=3048010 RepID=A0AAE3UGK2_9BACT|nr:DNA/RNA non-specific endonuclease [Xanthocytophaga agilis]MDJ1502562.1 DNA/RNA non-specific endonuclease [Xanthocytophaga agilis]
MQFYIRRSTYVLVIISLVTLWSCKRTPVSPQTSCDYPTITTTSAHLLMGNPSGAKKDESQSDNYLMEKTQYALSYNRSQLISNWAAWHLGSEDIGSADRQDDFKPDASLPSGWDAAKPNDYSGSGFDRGHLCPSADRTATQADNSATFLMTNMVPQSPDLNRNTWESLESYCRDLVQQGNELYIYAGTFGSGGTGSNGTATKVKDKITVPEACWKVLIVMPKGDDDVKRVTKTTQTIAIWAPNNQDLDNSWKAYAVSVDEVEQKTGYDFFNHLPVCIQEVIEKPVFQ